MEDRGLIVGRGKDFLSSPLISDRLWSPPRLTYNGHRRLFPQGLRGRGVKLTTYLHQVLRLRMRGLLPPPSPRRDNFTFIFTWKEFWWEKFLKR